MQKATTVQNVAEYSLIALNLLQTLSQLFKPAQTRNALTYGLGAVIVVGATVKLTLSEPEKYIGLMNKLLDEQKQLDLAINKLINSYGNSPKAEELLDFKCQEQVNNLSSLMEEISTRTGIEIHTGTVANK